MLSKAVYPTWIRRSNISAATNINMAARTEGAAADMNRPKAMLVPATSIEGTKPHNNAVGTAKLVISTSSSKGG